MAARIKIECKNCGGDIGDVVHLPEGGRAKVCRNCGDQQPMKSRTSKRRKELEALVRSLACSP